MRNFKRYAGVGDARESGFTYFVYRVILTTSTADNVNPLFFYRQIRNNITPNINPKNRKIMKKILITTAIISLLFAGCNKEKDKVMKLPSKRTATTLTSSRHHPLDDTIHFRYDDLNRLVSINNRHGSITITYNADHTPRRVVAGNWSYSGAPNETIFFQYDNNLVITTFCWTSCILTLTLNVDKQLMKWTVDCPEGDKFMKDFTYNSNGNIIKRKTWNSRDTITTATYSDVKSIWRYVNIPDWFLFFFSNRYFFVFCVGDDSWSYWGFTKKGYMPSELESTPNYFPGRNRSKFAYELDADGYVRRMNSEHINTIYTNEKSVIEATFEYVLAK